MKLAGFTYIEVILMMALMIFIGILASPFYGNFLFGQESERAAQMIERSLAEARFNSMMGKGNSEWGVALDGDRIVLFKGPSYGGRDPSFDQSYVLHELVSVSGLSEIVFGQRTGIPSTTLTMTISTYANASAPATHVRTLSVNTLGVVEEYVQ